MWACCPMINPFYSREQCFSALDPFCSHEEMAGLLASRKEYIDEVIKWCRTNIVSKVSGGKAPFASLIIKLSPCAARHGRPKAEADSPRYRRGLTGKTLACCFLAGARPCPGSYTSRPAI